MNDTNTPQSPEPETWKSTQILLSPYHPILYNLLLSHLPSFSDLVSETVLLLCWLSTLSSLLWIKAVVACLVSLTSSRPQPLKFHLHTKAKVSKALNLIICLPFLKYLNCTHYLGQNPTSLQCFLLPGLCSVPLHTKTLVNYWLAPRSAGLFHTSVHSLILFPPHFPKGGLWNTGILRCSVKQVALSQMSFRNTVYLFSPGDSFRF